MDLNMDLNTLRSLSTLICLGLFLGIVWWAYRGKNAQRFNEDAMLPFALEEFSEASSTPLSADGREGPRQ